MSEYVDPRIMAAAEGMLKVASAPVIFDGPECPELTIQVRDLVLPDAPPASPPAQGGAEQESPDINIPTFEFHFPDTAAIVSDEPPFSVVDEVLAREQETALVGEANLTASKAHFQSKYILIKPLSSGDNGETHAAISKADVINVASRFGGDSDSKAFCNAIRAKLVAVKFAKPDNLEGDLTNDITFLRETFPARHKSINYHLDSHLNVNTQWLVLPFAPYGSLQSFLRKCDEGYSLSFRWHTASQLAQALLFLFFGVESIDQPLPMLPPRLNPVTHGDIFVGNTLVGPADPQDPTSFPSLILSDFGRAREVCEEGACRHCSGNAARSNDMQLLGEMLEHLQQTALELVHDNEHTDDDDDDDDDSADCTQYEALTDRPDKPERSFGTMTQILSGFNSRLDDGFDVWAILKYVVLVGEAKKLETFRPFEDDNVAAVLRRPPYVSNDDLRRALGAFHR